MKRTLILALSMMAAVGAMAQGFFNFANLATALPGQNAVNAPVIDKDSGLKLNNTYLAQAYVGTDKSSLTPVGSPVAFLANGFFQGGKVTTAFAGGASVWVEVRAWKGGPGITSWANAMTRGESVPIQIALGDPAAVPPQAPPNLVGLASWTVQVIPEPSTIALGVLGASVLFLRRRK